MRSGLGRLSAGRLGGVTGWRPMRPVVLRAAGYPFGWLDELAGDVAGPEDYERVWTDGAEAVAARFRGDPTLRDALLVSNETSNASLIRWLDRTTPGATRWTKDDRQKLDTLVRYMQRVCAKNDTMSHLGTLAVGRFDPGEPAAAAARPAPLRRVTLLSRWAAGALAARMGDDPRVWSRLRPRPAPGAVVEGRTLRATRFAYGERTDDLSRAVRPEPDRELDPALALLLLAVDGERTVADLARLAGRPIPATVDRLRELERLGALACGPEIPFGVADPLAWLRAWLAEPDETGWASVLDALTGLLGELAAAAPERRPAALAALRGRFQAVTGGPAERGRGGFYSDRAIWTEECEGRVADLRVGRPLLEAVAGDLGRACDLALAGPRRRLLTERALLAGWLERRFPGRAEVPVMAYLRAYLEDLPELEPEYARIDREVRALHAALERRLVPDGAWADPVVRLPAARVEAALAESAGCRDAAIPAICNPDLLLVRGDGELLAVVGEIHLGEENLTHGMFAPFIEAAAPGFAAEAATRCRELLEDDEELVDVTLHHRNKTFARSPLPCPDLEACDRSPLARSVAIPLHRLTIHPSPAGPRLRAPGFERFLRPLALPLTWLGLPRNPFHAFGFPQSDGGRLVEGEGRPHVPRLVLGRLAIQREEWRVPAPELAGDRREGFVRAQAVRRERGLPRRVFVRGPREMKPVYCDLDSPVLVRHLTRTATAAGEREVALTEMLPGPEGLWLEVDGRRHTSELRFALFTRGRRPC